MAKSRSSRSPRRRTAKAPKRKSSRKSTASPKRNVIRLKPLYAEIGRVLKQLEQFQKRRPPSAIQPFAEAAVAPEADPVSLAIARLTQHQRDFVDICGPTMEIPAP